MASRNTMIDHATVTVLCGGCYQTRTDITIAPARTRTCEASGLASRRSLDRRFDSQHGRAPAISAYACLHVPECVGVRNNSHALASAHVTASAREPDSKWYGPKTVPENTRQASRPTAHPSPQPHSRSYCRSICPANQGAQSMNVHTQIGGRELDCILPAMRASLECLTDAAWLCALAHSRVPVCTCSFSSNHTQNVI